MLSTMDQGLAVFILLSLAVAAQTQSTTLYINNMYTQVSVPQSQLETTQIVKQPIQLSQNIKVSITAEKNVTRCAELSISSCPDPELLVAVSANTNNSKTYSYSKNVTGGLTLTINIGSTITFHPTEETAAAGQAFVNLIYTYSGNLGSLNKVGNSSLVTVRFVNSVALPNGGDGQDGGSSGPENGQPALYHRGLFGIMALMLLPAFLLH